MSNTLYTIEMFENDLQKNKKLLLIRNGEFVGLYRYENKSLFIHKRLNKKSYGFKEIIKMKDSGSYFGYGGSIRESSLINVNEAHFIPKGFDFRKKKDFKYLDDCLGGSHSQVSDRLASYVDRKPGYGRRMWKHGCSNWIYRLR